MSRSIVLTTGLGILVLDQETDGVANSAPDIAEFLLKFSYQALLLYDVPFQLPGSHFPVSRHLGDLFYMISEVADFPLKLVVFSP
jgi:hypothetical protein